MTGRGSARAPVPLIVGLEHIAARSGGLNRVVAEHMRARETNGIVGSALVLGREEMDEGAGDANVIRVWGRGGMLGRLASIYQAVRARDGEFDILISHFALTGLPAALASRRPVIMAFHGPWAAEAKAVGATDGRVRVARAVEKLVYRRSDAFITDSRSFRDCLVDDYGVHPGAVTAIPLGVDLERFRVTPPASARAMLDLPARAFIVVCVRRLVPRMGHETLIRAWQEMATDDDVLLIAGDGPVRGELGDLVERLGLSGSVRLLGHVSDEDLPLLYAAADVSVIPTLELEGFGLISLESMACGTPVIASAQGGLLEALDGSAAHTLVPPGDVRALTEALACRRAASNPDERLAARAHAETFSWDAQVAETDALAARVVTGPPARPWRVVVVDHCAKPSGGQIAMERLISALGHRASVHILVGEDGPMVARWRAAGATVEIQPLPGALADFKREAGRLGGLRTLTAVGVAAGRLAGRLRDLRPDVVHCNSAKACIYGALAARPLGLPVVWHVRDRIDAEYLPASTAAVIGRAAAVLPTQVVANSQSTLDTIPRLPRPGIVSYSPIPDQPTAQYPGAPVIGIAGRIADWKGHAVLLRAVASLDDLPDVRVRVAGAPLFGEEPLLRDLQALADQLGVADRVEWLGHVDDLGVERGSWGVAVHASTIAEPFGMSVVEAMASGLPTIATVGGGPSEVITTGVDGVLVPPGDPEQLAVALRRVLGDPEFARSLGRAATVRARAFSPGTSAETVLRAWTTAAR
jgi:glycosyltransferase involved in cell wall biosynthesis